MSINPCVGCISGYYLFDRNDPTNIKVMKLAINVTNVLSYIPQISWYVSAGRFAACVLSNCLVSEIPQDFLFDLTYRGFIESLPYPIQPIIFALDVIVTTNRYVCRFMPVVRY